MDEKVICVVMLYSYKDLERLCERVDERVLSVALRSRKNDVYDSVEKIFKLTTEKISYCNIKVIIDEAINKTGRNTEVKAYHIDGLYYKDIIAQEEITECTYMRRIKRQRAKIYKAITDKYDGEYLAGLIRSSATLLSRYNQESMKQSPK